MSTTGSIEMVLHLTQLVIVFEEFVDEPTINGSYVLLVDIAFIKMNVVDLVSFIHRSKKGKEVSCVSQKDVRGIFQCHLM